jgi:hypothetical protein
MRDTGTTALETEGTRVPGVPWVRRGLATPEYVNVAYLPAEEFVQPLDGSQFIRLQFCVGQLQELPLRHQRTRIDVSVALYCYICINGMKRISAQAR